MIKSGSVWAGTFVTLDATGALAAGTPSGTLYVDGVANGASVTITGSNPYKFSVTLPTLTAGQRVDMYITATISGIATAAIVASEQADTRLLSDGVTLADDAITAGKFDESTAFPVKSADTGATQIARVGADSDTLETLSDEIAAVKAETALIVADTGTDGVVLKAAGLDADAVTEIVAGVWGSNLDDYTAIDEAGGEILTAIGNVAAIKAKTDNLPADPADESSLEAAIAAVPTLDAAGVRTAVGLASANLDTQLAGIQADLDNTSQYKADVSGLATAAALTTVDGIVDAIKAKTDNLPSDPADQSILAGAIAALPLASDYTAVRAAKLDYLDAAISSRATSGEGTISWTYTLTASDNVTPIQYATVWVTSDAAGTAIEASGQTDAAGQVTFLLNAGTYYVWRKKSGYRFQNPDVEVVV